MSAPLRVRVWCGPCHDWIALGQACPHYDTDGLPLPPLTVHGAWARAEALAAGRPDWHEITTWPVPEDRDACPECLVGRVVSTGPAEPDTGWQPAKCSRDCGWVQ